MISHSLFIFSHKFSAGFHFAEGENEGGGTQHQTAASELNTVAPQAIESTCNMQITFSKISKLVRMIKTH